LYEKRDTRIELEQKQRQTGLIGFGVTVSRWRVGLVVVLAALPDDEEPFSDGSSFAFVVTLSRKTLKSVWQPT